MTGWICYNLDDKQQLVDLGVQLVGEPKKEEILTQTVEQRCIIPSEEVMSKLDPFWGQFVWGLD